MIKPAGFENAATFDLATAALHLCNGIFQSSKRLLPTDTMTMFWFIGLLFASATTAQTCMTPTARFQPKMEAGYTSTLLINGLKNPRDMVFDQLGNLLVVEQGGGGVTQIKFEELSCGYVCALSSKTVLADPTVSALV